MNLSLLVTVAETLAEEFYSGFHTVLWESLCLLDRVRGEQQNLKVCETQLSRKTGVLFPAKPELKSLAVPGLCVMPWSLCAVSGDSSTVQLWAEQTWKLMEVPLWLRLNIKISKEFWILFYVQIIMLQNHQASWSFACYVSVHVKLIWQVGRYICETLIAKTSLKFMFKRLMYLLRLNTIQQTLHVFSASLAEKACT